MAAQNLPAFPLTGFAQLIPQLCIHEIQQINRVLQVCDFSDDWVSCRERAVVHHRESEADLCLRHFQEVERG